MKFLMAIMQKKFCTKAYLGGEKGGKSPTRNFLKNLYYFDIFILLDYFQIKDKGRKKSLKFSPSLKFPLQKKFLGTALVLHSENILKMLA